MTVGLRLASGVHEHTPLEVTSFGVTFVNGLGSGETISTVDASEVVDDDQPSLGAAVVIDSTQIVSPVVVVVISGGTAGATNMVKLRVITSLGQTLEGAVQVNVQNAVEVT